MGRRRDRRPASRSAGFFAGTVLELGTDEQQQRWVPPLCGPTPLLGALATTEPEAGSDAAAIATHARGADDGYVLNGQKTWISNAGVADVLPRVRHRRPRHALEGHHGLRRRARRPGLRGRAEDGQARPALHPDRRAVPATTCRARRPAHRRRGPGLPRPDGEVRPLARRSSRRPRSASAARRWSTRSSTHATARRWGGRSTRTRRCRSGSSTRA